MLYKITTKLFRGKYQYKIVLVCSVSAWFRSGDMPETIQRIKELDSPKRQDAKEYGLKIALELLNHQDVDVRVESPWISVYTNDKKLIDRLAKIDKNNVKYISEPAGSLEENTILMPKMNFDYRITLGKTTQEHSSFIAWAESNPKLKLTPSCKKDLLKERTWGGKHFYLTGDNNLLLAKMHLGGSIAKIERIVKK